MLLLLEVAGEEVDIMVAAEVLVVLELVFQD